MNTENNNVVAMPAVASAVVQNSEPVDFIAQLAASGEFVKVLEEKLKDEKKVLLAAKQSFEKSKKAASASFVDFAEDADEKRQEMQRQQASLQVVEGRINDIKNQLDCLRKVQKAYEKFANPNAAKPAPKKEQPQAVEQLPQTEQADQAA